MHTFVRKHGRILLEIVPHKYYRLGDSGSIQGSHRPVIDREGNKQKARTVITQLAKLSIDRSGEVTTDVYNLVVHNKEDIFCKHTTPTIIFDPQ